MVTSEFASTLLKPHKPKLYQSFVKEPSKPTHQVSSKMDIQQHDRKEGQHLTADWRNGGCSASYDSFVVGSSAVLRLNFCSKNPPLRQPPNR